MNSSMARRLIRMVLRAPTRQTRAGSRPAAICRRTQSGLMPVSRATSSVLNQRSGLAMSPRWTGAAPCPAGSVAEDAALAAAAADGLACAAASRFNRGVSGSRGISRLGSTLEVAEQRLEWALDEWRARFPTDGLERRAEPDRDRLAYLLAGVSDNVVLNSLDRTRVRFPSVGSDAAEAFLADLDRAARNSWRDVARTAWLIELACPACDGVGLELRIVGRRPDIGCECGWTMTARRARRYA
jgi:hypothetical protein